MQRKILCAILGQSEIRTDGIRLTPEGERQFGLALFYCVNAGREIPRDEVAAMFWPEQDAEAARHCLRQALYRLRAVGVPVRSGASATTLDERLVEADYGPVVAEGASADAFLPLSEVTVLPGYTPRFSEPFSRWIEELRTELGARMRRGLVRAIGETRSRGKYGDVERLARHCLVLDPLNEEATLALAESVALAGGKAEAIRIIDRYVEEIGERKELRIAARILKSRVSDLVFEWGREGASRVPLVGREEEMEWLLAVLRDVIRGEPRFVMLWGEGGIGKTAIVEEFLRVAELRNAASVRVLCQSGDSGRTLSTLCETMTQLLGMRGALGASPQSLEDLRPLVSYHATGAPEAESLSPQMYRRRLLEAAVDVIDAVAEEGPLVVLLDDAHWADAESLRVLLTATRPMPGRRLLVVACLRPVGGRAGESMQAADAQGVGGGSAVDLLFAEAHCERRQVRPLSAPAARRLATALLGSFDPVVLAERMDDLLRLAGGNPLFVVELARRVRERPYETFPATINALLDGRIQARSSLGITVLQACSVLAKHATLGRLERVLELPAFELTAALNELEGCGLLVGEEDRIQCCHELVADAAGRSMTQSAQALLRRRAATVLEADALTSGDPALLWQSATYWEATQEFGSARRVLEQLSEYLLRIGSVAEAREALERALQYCEGDEETMKVAEMKLRAERISGDWKELLRTIRLRDDIRSANPSVRRQSGTDALMRFEALFRTSTDLDGVLRTVVAELRERPFTVDERIALMQVGLMVADNTLNADAAREIYESKQAINARTFGSHHRGLSTSLIYHTTFGDLNTALSIGSQIRTSTADLGEADVHDFQRFRWTCYPLIYAGDFDQATHVLERIAEAALTRKYPTEAFDASEELVLLTLLREDPVGARRWLQTAEALRLHAFDSVAGASLAAARALTALWERRPSEATADLQALESYVAERPRCRPRLRYLGIRLALELQAGAMVSPAIPSELESLLASAWNFGGNDIAACALVAYFLQQGNVAKGEALLREYARQRRERYPLPRFLQEEFLATRSLSKKA